MVIRKILKWKMISISLNYDSSMSVVPPQPADYSARSFLNDDVGMAKDRGIIKAKFQGAWILHAYIFTFQQTENVRVSKPSCKPNFTYPSNP